jgi:hypothetical protein
MSFGETFKSIVDENDIVEDDDFEVALELPTQYPTDDFAALKTALETEEPSFGLFQAVQCVLQRPPPTLGMSEIELRARYDARPQHLRLFMTWERCKEVAAHAEERHAYLVKALARLQKDLFGD